MEENKIIKILKICGFIVLMGISTWATVESIHRSLNSIPVIGIWALSIMFFIIASWGVSLIIISTDQSKRVNGRGYKLIGGLLVFIFFWVVFILPTNTHTFFYNNNIESIAKQEVIDTKSSLEQILIKGPQIISDEKDELKTKVNILLTNYCKEIDDPTNLGEGKKAGAIFEDIQSLIGEVQHPDLKSKSYGSIKQHKNLVRQNVEAILKIKLKDYDNKIFNYVNPANKSKIKNLIAYLDNKNTNKFKLNGNNKLLFDAIKEAQVLIKLYSDKLSNKELTNNNKLTVESEKTKIEKLEDVFEVWKNYFKGNYKGRGFAFWCLGAALIDIAGFILYHMAFKKDEY